MGLFPVTVLQFQAFVQDGAYCDSRLWKEAQEAKIWRKGTINDRWIDQKRTEPAWFNEQQPFGNRPVVGITWYEGLAFTRWAHRRWRKAGILPRELKVQLPSEAEWEKAARGGEQIPYLPVVKSLAEAAEVAKAVKSRPNPAPRRPFPWQGDFVAGLCNGKDAGIGSASCVGAFPKGAGPFGCLDMSGNVWEWTRSCHDGSENPQLNDLLVLRGGSFWDEEERLGCPSRGGVYPGGGDDGFGFRLALSP